MTGAYAHDDPTTPMHTRPYDRRMLERVTTNLLLLLFSSPNENVTAFDLKTRKYIGILTATIVSLHTRSNARRKIVACALK